jgi:hypothetical protein
MRACRIGSCPQPATIRGRCARHARPVEDVRALYKTARWLRLRAAVLREQPWCPDCHARGVTRATQDVHHRLGHGGNVASFYAREHLMGLCHPHHSARTARGE